MAEFVWKKEHLLNKIIYCIGWTGVLNLIFWISIVIVANLSNEKKFWNKNTHFVIYVWGWIFVASLLLIIILAFFTPTIIDY